MSRGVRFHLEGNSDMPTISESDTDDNGTDTESSNETIGENQHKLSANDYHKYDNQAFERELDNLAETVESPTKTEGHKVRFFQSASESHPTGAMGAQNLEQDSGSRMSSPVEEEPEQTDVSSIVADIMAAPGNIKDSHSPVTLRDKAQARTITRQNTKVPKQLLIELFDRVRIPVQLESSKSNKDLNSGTALNNKQTHTWQQTARFMKYEEDAVGIDQHFGKAHVPFLTLKSLMQLKKLISQVNCEVSPWASWSQCSTSCGPGTKTRTVQVLKAAAHGGQQCPSLSETIHCEKKKCTAIHCQRDKRIWGHYHEQFDITKDQCTANCRWDGRCQGVTWRQDEQNILYCYRHDNMAHPVRADGVGWHICYKRN